MQRSETPPRLGPPVPRKFALTGPGPFSPEGPTLEQCKRALRIIRAHAVLPDNMDMGAERDLKELFGEWMPTQDGLQRLKDSIHPLGPVLTPEDVREWLVEFRTQKDSIYAAGREQRRDRIEQLKQKARSRMQAGESIPQIVEAMLRHPQGSLGVKDFDEAAAIIREAVREAQAELKEKEAAIAREVARAAKDQKGQPQRNSKEQWGKDIARALRKMDGSRSPPMGSMDECLKAVTAECERRVRLRIRENDRLTR